MSEPFYKRIFTKPPVVFPLVALFHLIWLGYSISIFYGEPFPSFGWLEPLWMLLYALSWLFICDLKKKAGYMYILLTLADLVLRFMLKNQFDTTPYLHSFFPTDLLLCFVLLVYFNRLS